MEIDYIHMKNFRQYLDVRIEFSRSPSKNFTVIQGVNGAGKTNLLNATTWCLFGEERHIDSKYKGLPIVNTTTLQEGKSDIFEVKVEIQFIESDGNKMVVTRSKHYKKGKDGNLLEVPSPHSLAVMQQRGRDWVGPIYGDDAQYVINNRIPPSIEEYFFFDGERLDEYFKENTGRDIRSAVFQISQLELFERVIEHLNVRRGEFLKAARGLSSRAEELRDMLEIHTRSLATDKRQLEELLQKKNEAERLEREFSEKLKKSSLEHIQQLEEQRDALNDDLKRIDSDIVEIEETRLKLLHRNMPIILSYDALLKTKNLIEGRREAGLIPPPYRTIFIENLLKKGKCICGCDISGKDEYSTVRRKRVEMHLADSQLSEKSNEIITANTLIRKMMESTSDFPDQIIELNRKLRKLNELRDEKEQKLRKIEQEIRQCNVENIKIWEREREKYAQEKERLIGEIAKQQSMISKRDARARLGSLFGKL